MLLLLRLTKFRGRGFRSWSVFSILMISSGMFANACDSSRTNEFYEPVTNGDGIRYPLALSPAIWKVAGCIDPVLGTDGLIHLAYTVQLTNHTANPMTIQSFEVVDPDNKNIVTGHNKVVSILNENITSLVQPFTLPPTLDQADYSQVLAGGQTGEVYFDVTYPNLKSVPAHISHRVTVTQSSQNTPVATYTAIDEPITVGNEQPIILSPPLKGPRWFDGNGCCKQIGPHRGVMSPINGQIRPAEMFAIDFVQLDAKGRGYTGNVKDLSSYAYYGADIYAAAPGTVVEVVRDLPNTVPGANPPTTTADAASGNHVIMDVGAGHYIMYAHLIPGSPTVQVGDVVPKGYVLGKLGNSGNSSGPHLHFQVMDRPSALGANGLPFVFDHLTREATAVGTLESAEDNFNAGIPLPLNFSTAAKFDNTMPLELDLLNFKF
jgi:murein DD-endopeptidase MepM/ murein hydrolase activator NlpD